METVTAAEVSRKQDTEQKQNDEGDLIFGSNISRGEFSERCKHNMTHIDSLWQNLDPIIQADSIRLVRLSDLDDGLTPT